MEIRMGQSCRRLIDEENQAEGALLIITETRHDT